MQCRGRGRPKLTWVESVKRDLKDWNISKEIALDRSAWRLAINVPEPWTYFFRVSSLAYPNLLGKKGYVVVVVVVHWHALSLLNLDKSMANSTGHMLKATWFSLMLIFDIFCCRLWSLISCIRVRVSIGVGIMDFASPRQLRHGIRQHLSWASPKESLLMKRRKP